MANVSKDRDRSGYRVKWRDPSGKHKTESGFRTRREALTRRDEINTTLRKLTYVDPKEGQQLFRGVARAWLGSKVELKPRTFIGYEAMLASGKDIDKNFGDWPVDAITRQQVQEWVNARSRAGRKPTTVRNGFFVVRQVLAQAVADKRIVANPCEHVRLPKTQQRNGSVEQTATALNAEQVDKLTDELPWPFDVLVLGAGSK